MCPKNRITQAVVLGLGIVCSLPVLADSQDKVQLVHKDKSTLETFPMKSLDQEDLSDAVIGGTLEAPSAGPQDATPKVANLLPKELQRAEDDSDLGHYNVSVTINRLPQPASIEGRTYGWDYNLNTRH